jgi:Flp pilus assembly protein TadD
MSLKQSALNKFFAISGALKPQSILMLLVALALNVSAFANDKEVRVSIPKRTHATPVQKYNQDGVKALQKQHIDTARKLFYKAYLLDPNDPFTLNNLGYLAELDGDVDRAQRFYELAAANGSQASVESSNTKELEGKAVSEVAGKAEGGQLQVNRLNVRALSLLQQDRAIEAEAVLQKALKLDPTNPFTLNNMGYAREQQGELESALKFYNQAAATRSDEKVIVAVNSHKDWRGKKISEVAQENAEKLRGRLGNEESVDDKVARLNLRGVSALSRNDRKAARAFFEQATKMDPENAFSLNNMGYVAELDGDRETANYYYEKAQQADRAKVKVGVATRKEAEGKPLQRVADNNENMVDAKMQQEANAKRQSKGQPSLLKRNGNNQPANPLPPEPELKARPKTPTEQSTTPPTSEPPKDNQNPPMR